VKYEWNTEVANQESTTSCESENGTKKAVINTFFIRVLQCSNLAIRTVAIQSAPLGMGRYLMRDGPQNEI
jgi:hypothetical protein